MSEDAAKDAEADVQNSTDKFIAAVDNILLQKKRDDGSLKVGMSETVVDLFSTIETASLSSFLSFLSGMLAKYTPDNISPRQAISIQVIFSPSQKPQNSAMNGMP
jgi:hypothetical protein